MSMPSFRPREIFAREYRAPATGMRGGRCPQGSSRSRAEVRRGRRLFAANPRRRRPGRRPRGQAARSRRGAGRRACPAPGTVADRGVPLVAGAGGRRRPCGIRSCWPSGIRRDSGQSPFPSASARRRGTTVEAGANRIDRLAAQPHGGAAAPTPQAGPVPRPGGRRRGGAAVGGGRWREARSVTSTPPGAAEIGGGAPSRPRPGCGQHQQASPRRKGRCPTLMPG